MQRAILRRPRLLLTTLAAAALILLAAANAGATIGPGEVPVDQTPGGPCDNLPGNGVPSCSGGIPPQGTLIPCIDPMIPCDDNPGWEPPAGPVDDPPETGFTQHFCQVKIVSATSTSVLRGSQGVGGHRSLCPKNLDLTGPNATVAVQGNFALAQEEIREIGPEGDKCVRASASTGDVLEIRYAVKTQGNLATHPWEGRCLRRKSTGYVSIGSRSDVSPPFFFETTNTD